ncbi:SusC/RagA family TonB-linked outer membrane protein [Mucilaginibacter conchicola]|uniref:SusC/RagA family TonB-linked outer membrane protein n=1 Tax=Mucilaginibacter conchicola TaxID=2303333 RepID=A0A372NQN0_9SPHI|nr:SusC/RagA family TonB-linked outer membrane protein [Mucilaginibacter conchicola]RFZ90927.1 SusC/RagA family TonB-linked outer membrane protein [Mucilaginibacter conchicola]
MDKFYLTYCKKLTGQFCSHYLLKCFKLGLFILLAFANYKSYGQSNITLKTNKEALNSVLKKIRIQSGYDFLIDAEASRTAKPVTIDIKQASIDDAVKACLAGQQLTYKITEHTVVIKLKLPEKPKKIDSHGKDSVVVTGFVTSSDAKPLIGATVLFLSNNKGVTTDSKGRYFITTNRGKDSLVFRFIGYNPVKKAISDRQDNVVLDVVMEEARNELDQVVVQGYTKTTKRESTGDVTVISGDEIAKRPVMNPLLALQGKVPGVTVTPITGSASGPVKIEIRGRKGINESFTGEPLYIIDGVPAGVLDIRPQAASTIGQSAFSAGYDQAGLLPSGGISPLFSLDAKNIESISVLKDADATAIYGSRGANGVILITTKKGKAGAPTIGFDINRGVNFVTVIQQRLNTPQYLATRREAFANDGIAPTPLNAPELFVFDQNRYTDWGKYLLGGTANNTSIGGNISGGDKLHTYLISGDYGSSKDLTTVSGVNQRGSLSINLSNQTADQRLSYNLIASYALYHVNQINVEANAALAPNAPAAFTDKGDLNWAGWGTARSSFPFAGLLRPVDSRGNTLSASFTTRYLILKGLDLNATLGYSLAQGKTTKKTPLASQDPTLADKPVAESIFSTSDAGNKSARINLSYNFLVGKAKFNFLSGARYEERYSGYSTLRGRGYANDALLNSIVGASIVAGDDEFAKYKYLGFFAQATVSFDNAKYNLNLNGVRDGSSHFGENNRFGNFWSIGLSWNAEQEKWIKSWLPAFVSSAHFHASIGISGSDPVADYKYLSQYGNYPIQPLPSYGGVAPLLPLIQPNPYFQWQVNRSKEVGLNLAFLDDRLNFSVAYSLSRCNNQLLDFLTPSITGFNSVVANSPADVQNRTWEFSFSGTLINKENFKWNLSTNYSFNKNYLLAYPNLEQSPYASTLKIGKSLDVQYVTKYTGVDPLTGFYTFEDRDHDGRIRYNLEAPGTGDYYIPISTTPKFDIGLANTFTYKRLSVYANIILKKQIGISPEFISEKATFAGITGNLPAYLFEQRWQHPGDKAIRARLSNIGSGSKRGSIESSDAGYTDASYIRLSALECAYQMPDKWVKKLGLNSLSIKLSGSNIFLITKYRGLDPEVQGTNAIPPFRTITGGLSASL